MKALTLLVLLVFLTIPAEATVFFDDNLEGAVPPLGVPPGWGMLRSWNKSNISPTPPFVDGATDQSGDMCYFTTERAHSGSISLKHTWIFDQGPYLDANGNPQEAVPPFGTGVTNNPNWQADSCHFFFGNDDNAPTNGIPPTRELYIRAWIYSVNYGIGYSENKHIYMHTSPGGTGVPYFVISDKGQPNIIGYQGPNINIAFPQDCPPDSGDTPAGTNTYTSCDLRQNLALTAVPDNQWNCHEWHMKMNTAGGGSSSSDAVLEAWVNGTPYMSYTGFRISGPNASNPNGNDCCNHFLGFDVYRQNARLGSVWYWDDIAAGDTRIGCGVGPPSAPGTPSNLNVVMIAAAGLATAMMIWRRR